MHFEASDFNICASSYRFFEDNKKQYKANFLARFSSDLALLEGRVALRLSDVSRARKCLTMVSDEHLLDAKNQLAGAVDFILGTGSDLSNLSDGPSSLSAQWQARLLRASLAGEFGMIVSEPKAGVPAILPKHNSRR